MNDKRMIGPIWDTKFALTSGIKRVQQVEHCVSINENMICWVNAAGYEECRHGKDWHLTPGAAISRAIEMRRKKIMSLKKQLARLADMAFDAPA